MADAPDLLIRTSAPQWLREVAAAYRARVPFKLEDDAHVGIDPREETLFQMGRKASLSRREWAGVLISLGIAGVGAWLLVVAVLDPEPFTKVASAIGTGAVLLGTGGLGAVRILTHLKPPNIRVSKAGTFEIYWS